MWGPNAILGEPGTGRRAEEKLGRRSNDDEESVLTVPRSSSLTPVSSPLDNLFLTVPYILKFLKWHFFSVIFCSCSRLRMLRGPHVVCLVCILIGTIHRNLDRDLREQSVIRTQTTPEHRELGCASTRDHSADNHTSLIWWSLDYYRI